MGEDPERGTARSAAAGDIKAILGRIRAIEHPGWSGKDEDITALKAAMQACASELEHLRFRYDQRGAELERLKASYAELEHLFYMRPDSMRKAAEMEVTDLVRRGRELAEREAAFEKARADAESGRARRRGEEKAELDGRRAELESSYAGRAAKLEAERAGLAARESAVAAAEADLRAGLDKARAEGAAEAREAFLKERAALESASGAIGSSLSAQAEEWRRKAAESDSALAAARAAAREQAKKASEAAEAAASDAQKRRLAEMDRDAALARLQDWEKKGAELERWRAGLEAREQACAAVESRAAGLEKDFAEKRAALERAKEAMRAEINDLVRRRSGGKAED